MSRTTLMSRRMALQAGSWTLAAAMGIPQMARAHTEVGLNPNSEQAIRKYYMIWEQRDWHPFDALLADDFTFSSAAGDDHISKSVFKERCWKTQKDFLKRFDLLRVFGRGDEAFVMYVGHTTNDRTFRNVEYVKVRDGRVEAIECYFGAPSNFTSAVATKPG